MPKNYLFSFANYLILSKFVQFVTWMVKFHTEKVPDRQFFLLNTLTFEPVLARETIFS
jgi:hypothetical protein